MVPRHPVIQTVALPTFWLVTMEDVVEALRLHELRNCVVAAPVLGVGKAGIALFEDRSVVLRQAQALEAGVAGRRLRRGGLRGRSSCERGCTTAQHPRVELTTVHEGPLRDTNCYFRNSALVRITVVDLTDFDKGGFAKDATGAGKCRPPVIQAMPAHVSTPSRHVKCVNVSN